MTVLLQLCFFLGLQEPKVLEDAQQAPTLDSLLAVVNSVADSDRKIDIFKNVNRNYSQKLQYQFYSQIENLDFVYDRAENQRIAGEYSLAVDNFSLYIEINSIVKNDTAVAEALIARGSIKYVQGKIIQALDDYQQAYELVRATKLSKTKASALIGLGLTYEWLGDNKKAKETHEKVLEIALRNDLKRIKAVCYANLGNLQFNQSHLVAARDFHDKALAVFQEIGDTVGIAEILCDIALDEELQADHNSAIRLFRESLNLLNQKGAYSETAKALLGLGRNFLIENEADSARIFLFRAREVADENTLLEIARDAAAQISKLEKQLGDYISSLRFYEEFKTLSDSLQDRALMNQALKHEMSYVYQQKQDSLTFSYERERTSLNKSVQDAKNRRNFALVLAIALLSIAVVIYASMTRTRRLNEMLEKTNEELRQKSAELEDANFDKARVFAMVSHDLKSPLTDLYSLFYLMKRAYTKGVTSDIKPLLDKFEYSHHRTVTLLKNVLSWGLLDSGNILIEFSEVPIKKAVLESVKQIEGYAIQKSIQILTGAVNSELVIRTDRRCFDLGLRNVLMNAIKFTDKHGQILITTSERGDTYVLSVADNGVGMTQKHLKTLFRVREKSLPGTQGETGSGIGLKVIFDLFKRIGGDIKATSSVGEGTKIDLIFPKSPKLK
ncbi:MAG: tetratricopeptide repeat-containing sensor histidine kinase [Bacteroidota bacterium]